MRKILKGDIPDMEYHFFKFIKAAVRNFAVAF